MNILIVTGEKSAENYASLLVDELSSIDKTLTFLSICSNILNDKTQKIADYREISIIGIKEAVGVINKAFKLLRKAKKSIMDNEIKMIVLLDFPEFNMRLAKFANKKGIKVVYYISPQVWAWREYRIKSLFKYSDLIIPILPFEKTFFNLKGVKREKLSYFGHPMVDLLHDKTDKNATREKIILIMPGSRKTEIRYNAAVMFEAAKELKEKLKDFRFIWVLPENIELDYAKKFLEGFDFIEIKYDSHSLMKKSYFGILKSGTTTLEAAMLGLPMVVVYKLSKTSYSLGKLLIRRIKYISLPNLIAGEPIVKELIGAKATKDNIVKECLEVCSNSLVYNRMKEQLNGISCALGEYPVTKRIANKIYSMV